MTVFPDWEPLSAQQKSQVRAVFKLWMDYKCFDEKYFRAFVSKEGFTPEFLATKFAVDMDHSSLLRRLLDGEQPLPEAP